MYDILKSRSNTPKSSSSLFSPYHFINDAETYFESYDVFIPVHDTGCGLLFATT
jgi:hypothetical protein